jgi:hypothetical protein
MRPLEWLQQFQRCSKVLRGLHVVVYIVLAAVLTLQQYLLILAQSLAVYVLKLGHETGILDIINAFVEKRQMLVYLARVTNTL